MVRDEKFSIISVDSDDNERVIQAGIPQVVEEAKIEHTPDTAPEVNRAVDADVKVKQVAEAHYITTQEDLEDEGPMKNMRLIILGIALLLVVAFIVYYFFLR